MQFSQLAKQQKSKFGQIVPISKIYRYRFKGKCAKQTQRSAYYCITKPSISRRKMWSKFVEIPEHDMQCI